MTNFNSNDCSATLLCVLAFFAAWAPAHGQEDTAAESPPTLPDTRVVAPRRAATDDRANTGPGNAETLAPAQSFSAPSFSAQSFPEPTLPARAGLVPTAPGAAAPPITVPNAGQVVSDRLSASSGGETGSSLTVISRRAIENSGQTELSEVLRQVPGVDVVRSGGLGQVTSVFIRGGNSNHTKVLIDGIPANDPSAPSRAFDFSFLNLDQVDRIEVLRGPQSALYGSDAIGGVINIITEQRRGPAQLKVSQSGGAFETGRTAASLSGGDDLIQYSIGGSYLDSDGISAAGRAPGNTEEDFFRIGAINGRLGLKLTENLRADFVGRYSDSDSGLDTAFDPTFTFPQDDTSSLEQNNTFARQSLTYVALDGLWTHHLGHSYAQYERNSQTPFGGEFYGRTHRYDWRNDLQVLRSVPVDLTVTSGVDFLREEFRNDSARQNQDDLGGFVMASGRLGRRLFLTTSARWDEYSTAGDAFTHRTTARYRLGTSATEIHGAFGTGFRAPALSELFGLVGNSALNPESSRGWEVGLTRPVADGAGTVDVTYFRNDFDNLINFAPNGSPPFFGQLENVDSALTSGVEVASVFSVGETTLFINYTYTHTRDRGSDTRLLRRPRNRWSFGASRTFWNNRANLSWNANYVGDRLDVGDNIAAAYWLVNASGSFRLGETTRLFGRIDNLLDQDYEEALGFAAAPIAAYAGAQWTF